MAITVQEHRRQLALTSAAGLGVAAIIVLLINVLANWVFFRLDLTRQHAYSLSAPSRKLVRELSDPVIVKAYFTPDLPSPYNIYERYVRDLLAEYRSASRGKVRFEFMLQSPPEEFERKAAEAGLLPIQFEQMGSDQLQIKRGYMGLVLFHRDKSETLPIVKDVQQLEYDITSRIAKMAQRAKKVVAVTSGHDESRWQSSPSKLAGDLSELYEVKEIALPAASTATFQADVLLVVGPKRKFDDASLWAIDQALMRGVPTAFLVDIKNLVVNQFYIAPLESGLGEFLKHYGVELGDRLVYDAQCETNGVTQNLSGFAFTTSIRYPYIPLVDRIMNTHPIGRGLDTVGLPFTTVVDATPALPSGTHFTTLLYTSPKSWLAKAEPYASVAPSNIPRPSANEPHGPYSVGGVLDGSFTSYFQGKTPPFPGQTQIGSSPRTQIFVLGTSRILDPSLPAFPGGDALVTNVLAYLSKDETLVGIRSKGEIIRPLEPVSDPVREIVKYGTVLLAAVLPVAFGLWRWRKREHWRQTISMTSSPAGVSGGSITP